MTPSAQPARVASPVITVVSPIDGKPIGQVPSHRLDEALAGLARARRAQKTWAALTHEQRERKLRVYMELVHRHRAELADILTAESGKTLFESYLFEVASILHLADYFLKHAPRILKPKRISISVFKNRTSYLHYRPRGVVLVISPWNFPLSNSMGEVLMGLIAGNAVLLKPASLTPLVAVRMRELADEAGLDPDLFQVVTCSGRVAGELIDQGDLNFVSFTGSTETGRRVAEACARRLIPCTMELGGKAPAVVLADADVENAARAVVWGAFANSGQICASVERCLVHERIYEPFLARVLEITKTLRQGDPRSGDVDVGAMVDPGQIEIVESLVKDALARGARALTGGRRAAAGRNFYEPTILVDVNEEMRVMKEESFGPLLPVMPFKDDEEAVRIANDVRYGLMANVFSRDQAHARQVAERLEAGTVIINDTLVTHAYPETPWQGVKESGFGRVHSDEGLRDLCVGYHVNHEVFSMENPTWYPYTTEKMKTVLAALDLTMGGLPWGAKWTALRALVSRERD